jgi:predicted PurR-regulated permease PerM
LGRRPVFGPLYGEESKSMARDDEKELVRDPPAQAVPPKVDVHSASLAVLAAVAVIYLLHWAQDVFIPLTLAIFLRYMLMPAVEWLGKVARVPTALGAGLVLAVAVGGATIGIASLQDEALDILDKVPRAARKLEFALRYNGDEGAISKLKNAAEEIDKAAASAAAPQSDPKPSKDNNGAALPQVKAYLLSGSLAVALGLAETMVVIALAYFLLAAGDIFRRKLVRISGDTFSEKKTTVEILHEIDNQVQRYLFVQLVASAAVGVLSWLALAVIGLENAAFWGVVSGVFHLIPYVGPTVAIVLAGIVAYLQFPDLTTVFLVLGSLLVIIGLIGFALMPLMTAKLGKVNAVTVFVALLFWGWLWGVWGLLLGVPIVMALQAVCERVPELQPVAELLGSEPHRPTPAETVRINEAAGETTARSERN